MWNVDDHPCDDGRVPTHFVGHDEDWRAWLVVVPLAIAVGYENNGKRCTDAKENGITLGFACRLVSVRVLSHGGGRRRHERPWIRRGAPSAGNMGHGCHNGHHLIDRDVFRFKESIAEWTIAEWIPMKFTATPAASTLIAPLGSEEAEPSSRPLKVADPGNHPAIGAIDDSLWRECPTWLTRPTWLCHGTR